MTHVEARRLSPAGEQTHRWNLRHPQDNENFPDYRNDFDLK